MDALVTHFAEILFYVLAAFAIAGAVGVVTFRSPVHSALSLLWTFLVVAALFLLRYAEFVAAVQVMVYAGGIMVLFLFVMMLVNVRRLSPDSAFLSNVAPAAVLGGVIAGSLIAIAVLIGSLAPTPAAVGDPGAELRTIQVEGGQPELAGNTEALGHVLFTRYLVPFEVVSMVLLVAMIGAIIFGRSETQLRDEGGESAA